MFHDSLDPLVELPLGSSSRISAGVRLVTVCTPRSCVSHLYTIGSPSGSWAVIMNSAIARSRLRDGISSSALIFTEQGHPVSGGIRGAHTSGVVTGPLSARGGGTVTVTSTPSKAVSL